MIVDLDEIIVTDAVYDGDTIPEIDHLSSRAALMRPEVQDDGKVKFAHAEHGQGDDLPPEMAECDDSIAPYRSVGRLAVHWNSAGKAVHGSAQLIAPNLVLTAGHCVHWAGQWNTNIYFLKRYKDGSAEPPTIKFDKIGVLRGWRDNTAGDDPTEAAWAYDFAVLRIAGGDAADHVGMTALSDDVTSFNLVGYPYKYNDGQIMLGSTAGRTDGIYEGTVGAKPSHMGFGASGGAWFTGSGDTAKVIGLNSFKMSTDPDVDYSPVFTEATVKLVGYMAGLG